jgi:hypothetical protein
MTAARLADLKRIGEWDSANPLCHTGFLAEAVREIERLRKIVNNMTWKAP